MLKTSYTSLALGLAFIFAPSLLAQEKPKPFEGPPVAKMPENCSFELSLKTSIQIAREKWQASNPDSIKLKPRRSHRIINWTVIKQGKTVKVTTITEAGRSGEFWIIDGFIIMKERSSETFWALMPDEAAESGHLIFSQNDFPHSGWIKVENFIRKTKWAAKDALEFSTAPPRNNTDVDPSLSIESPHGVKKAWVDIQTRLPLFIEDSGDLYTFKHFSTKITALQVPATVQAAYESARSIFNNR